MSEQTVTGITEAPVLWRKGLIYEAERTDHASNSNPWLPHCTFENSSHRVGFI